MKYGAIVGFGRLASGAGRNQNVFPKIWQPHSIMGGIDSLPNATLRAVCDPNLELMNQLDEGISKYADYKDLLEREDLDFLAIATRAPMRLKIATDAINAGCKRLHLEKPLCNDSKTLETFQSLLDHSETIFTYGALRRLLEPYSLIKGLIESKKFGLLSEIRFNYGVSGLFWSHTHTIDLILFFIESNATVQEITGKSSPITFKSANNLLLIESDPTISELTISFSNNQIARITSSPEMSIELYFDKGLLKICDDGRLVVFIPLLGDSEFKGTLWQEDEFKGIGGFAAPINLLITSRIGTFERSSDINRNMKDAVLGQEILFNIAKKLFLDQNPRIKLPKNPIFLGIGPTNQPA